jgi:hypothetical protein
MRTNNIVGALNVVACTNPVCEFLCTATSGIDTDGTAVSASCPVNFCSCIVVANTTVLTVTEGALPLVFSRSFVGCVRIFACFS